MSHPSRRNFLKTSLASAPAFAIPAMKSGGTSVHDTGPREWQARTGKIPVTTD